MEVSLAQAPKEPATDPHGFGLRCDADVSFEIEVRDTAEPATDPHGFGLRRSALLRSGLLSCASGTCYRPSRVRIETDVVSRSAGAAVSQADEPATDPHGFGLRSRQPLQLQRLRFRTCYRPSRVRIETVLKRIQQARRNNTNLLLTLTGSG